MSRRPPLVRILRLLPAGLVVVTVAILLVRSRATFEGAMAEPDPARALRELDAAAGFHLPGNPWSRRAVAEMARRAAALEAEGREREALAAYRLLRSTAAQARWAFSPFAAEERSAAAAVARLEERLDGAASDREPPRDPNPVAVAGFGLALAAALVLLWRLPVEPAGPRRRRLGLAAAAAFALFWLLLAVA